MRFLFLAWLIHANATVCFPQSGGFTNEPSASITLVISNQPQFIDVRVTIDGRSFDEYWNAVFDELLAFADVDQSGIITDNEVHLLPSARAMRQVMGSGFTPPIASLKTISDIFDDDTKSCSRDDVVRYYRKNGVGRVHAGNGKLPHSDALADAFINALDGNNSSTLSRQELSLAESSLQKLDTNDDELISATELLPNQIYPGCAATSPMDVSANAVKKGDENTSHFVWNIVLDETVHGEATAGSAMARPNWEAWSVTGQLANSFDELTRRISEAKVDSPKDEPMMIEVPDKKRDERRDDFAWLVPMVDRDSNGHASPDEITQWLSLQGEIMDGQLLVSVLSGGGLFELLDQNHDAGLSTRELRNAWSILESSSCTIGDILDREKLHHRTLLIASRGYPTELRKTDPSKIEWFRSMDRNSDGDVSRREFLESTEHFSKLDQDQDGLISSSEASRFQR
ncbi:MAG: hypothetical protein ABJ015_27780 [Rhodopirellula bahusiensis]